MSILLLAICENVDKTVNAGDDVCKCAESSKTNDCSLNNCALGIVVLERISGIVLSVLEAERNLLCFLVDVLYINVNSVANVNNLAGVLDVSP